MRPPMRTSRSVMLFERQPLAGHAQHRAAHAHVDELRAVGKQALVPLKRGLSVAEQLHVAQSRRHVGGQIELALPYGPDIPFRSHPLRYLPVRLSLSGKGMRAGAETCLSAALAFSPPRFILWASKCKEARHGNEHLPRRQLDAHLSRARRRISDAAPHEKENDLNHDKWIGVGGKFEDGESPEDCALRETREETGLTLTRWRYRGLVTFVSDRYETEYMHLFTADGWIGTPKEECDEGELAWIKKSELLKLRLWEGRQDFPAAARHGRAVLLAQAQV